MTVEELIKELQKCNPNKFIIAFAEIEKDNPIPFGIVSVRAHEFIPYIELQQIEE